MPAEFFDRSAIDPDHDLRGEFRTPLGEEMRHLEIFHSAFAAQIKAYKEGGFDRVNPSILKADIITAYPDFNERSIGFKRFSDVMKQLEKDGLVIVEMDEQKTMLIKLL